MRYLLNIALIFAINNIQAMLTPEQLSEAAAAGNIDAINSYYSALQAVEVAALESALKNNKFDAVELFLNRIPSFNTGQTLNINALALNKPYSLDYLPLLKKITTHTKLKPNNRDSHGNSALDYTIESKNINILRNLLALNANPFSKNPTTQKTSLELAKEQFPESLKYFVPYMSAITANLTKRPLPGSQAEIENATLSRVLLGLPEDFTQEDLKKAHRNLSLKWHPDKNLTLASSVENFSEFIKVINQAHSNLQEQLPTPAPIIPQQQYTQPSYSQTRYTAPTPQPAYTSSTTTSSTSYSTKTTPEESSKPVSVQDILNSGKPFTTDKPGRGVFDNVTSLNGINNIPNKEIFSTFSFPWGKFESIKSSYFQDFHNLKALKFNYGNLSNFQLSHPTLEELDLNYNTLSSISGDIILNLPQLTLLNISYNKLSKITDDAFSNTPQLEKLNLSNNNLTSASIASNAFANLVNLKELDLRGNFLEEPKDIFIKNHPMPKGVKVICPLKPSTKKQKTESSQPTQPSSTRSSSSTSSQSSYQGTTPTGFTRPSMPQYASRSSTPQYVYNQFEVQSTEFNYDTFGKTIGQKRTFNRLLTESPYAPSFWINRTPIFSTGREIIGFESNDGISNIFIKNLPDRTLMSNAYLEAQLLS